jgi:hypothetical protein
MKPYQGQEKVDSLDSWALMNRSFCLSREFLGSISDLAKGILQTKDGRAAERAV